MKRKRKRMTAEEIKKVTPSGYEAVKSNDGLVRIQPDTIDIGIGDGVVYRPAKECLPESDFLEDICYDVYSYYVEMMEDDMIETQDYFRYGDGTEEWENITRSEDGEVLDHWIKRRYPDGTEKEFYVVWHGPDYNDRELIPVRGGVR